MPEAGSRGGSNPDVEGSCPCCAGLARVPNPDRREESHVGARADPGFGNGGARFLAKRVTYTSEASYERSEYKSAGGPRGAVSPPEIC